MANILTANGVVEATTELTQAQIDSLAMANQAMEGAAQTTENLSIGFWDLFMGGGWLMWVLVVLAGVMIFIFVEKP